MDRSRLEDALIEAHDVERDLARIVARQARDLADSGRFADDLAEPLTVEGVLENIGDAPDEYGLVERWNWWLGALELSHGGYERFSVREDVA